MDFLKIIVFTVAVVAFPHLADAGCAQDTAADQSFTQCVMGYSTFIASAASSMDPNDPTAMISIMCSTEGKAAMKCVMDFVKACPELLTTGATSDMFQGIKMLDQFGGFEASCNMLSGPCTAVRECIEKQVMGGSAEPEITPGASFTPFSVIQPSMKTICGPLKGMFDCFKDVGEECKDLESNIKQFANLGSSNIPPGSIVPTYEQAKTFTMKECAKLPADFATSTCVKNALDSDKFTMCFANISRNNPSEEGKVTCDQVRAGHKCTSMTVGKNCGAEYTDVLAKVAPMFVAGMPKNCPLESNPSGSSVIHLSSVTIFAAVTLALKLI